MLSLAALRYRDVFTSEGGPIERVVSGVFDILGSPAHQANAFLSPGLSSGKPTHAVYGKADGTGSATCPAIACHMAISEALERWAFLATYDRPIGKTYGFDADRSSNGMAAFPGLFRFQAARRARHEALERLALISWWDGRIDAQAVESPFKGVKMLRLLHNFGKGEVVILHQSEPGPIAYGHAAGGSLREAARKASVELARNRFVIATHRSKGALIEPANYLERRALHFSSEVGYAEFCERLHRKAWRPDAPPRVVFDGEIKGPWTRWATVWRTSFAMPTNEYLNPSSNFFFW